MSRIKKIVLTSNDLGGMGGVGTFMKTMAHEFSRRGYDVELVGFDRVESTDELSDFRTLTVFDKPMPLAPRPKDYPLGARDPRYKSRRKKLNEVRRSCLKNLHPLIEHLDGETAVICAQVFAMENFLRAGFNPRDRQGPITFGQHHASFEHARKAGYLRRMLRAYANLDRMVALTEEDAELFTLGGMPATTAIANPVAMPDAGPNPAARTLVALGRYAPEKRFERILYAWSELRTEFPSWDVRLWGEGEERDSLSFLIADLNIGDTVSLMGPTDRVAEMFSESAINMLTSDNEGLPISIVEASRRSVPTVAMDCAPGISELIDDGSTGTIVPAKSTVAFVSALRELMKDEDKRLRMGAAACDRSKRYLPAVIIDRWEEEFERALR